MRPPDSQRFALYRDDLQGYMERWVFRTPWFNIRIHHILKSDEGRDLHDHPFDFTSLILSGGYTEVTPSRHAGMTFTKNYKAGNVLTRKAEALHRLILREGSTTWTLVFAGPRRRKWGFMTTKGWVYYQDYDRSLYGDP